MGETKTETTPTCKTCENRGIVKLLFRAEDSEDSPISTKDMPCPDCPGSKGWKMDGTAQKVAALEDRVDGLGKLIAIGCFVAIVLALLSYLHGKEPDAFAQAVKEQAA